MLVKLLELFQAPIKNHTHRKKLVKQELDKKELHIGGKVVVLMVDLFI
jgi:hypothetical protein